MGSTYTHRLRITLQWSNSFLQTAQCNTDTWVELCCNLDKVWTLEADLAAGYGVAQLGLIVDEGHDAQIGLNEQGPLQDQDPISSTGDGVLLVGFLHCLHQLSLEVVQLGEQKKKNMKPEHPSKKFQSIMLLLFKRVQILCVCKSLTVKNTLSSNISWTLTFGVMDMIETLQLK